MFSTNIIVPESQFKCSGTPKQYSRLGDSGGNVTSNFCPECGILIFTTADALPGLKIIKAGTLDNLEANNEIKPHHELYTKNRYRWVPELQDLKQFLGSDI